MLDFKDENTYEPYDVEYFDELMDEYEEDRYPIELDDGSFGFFEDDDYEEEEYDPGWYEDLYD